MSLTRSPHWATREFHSFLQERLGAPFVWGENDCSLFAANGILAMTGIDLAADFRGKYSDRASAFLVLKAVTSGSVVADAAAWCAAKHGLAEYVRDGKPAPLFAQRGDLVVANAASDDGTQIAGLVHLNGQIVSMSEKGLLRLPISAVVRAWKV